MATAKDEGIRELVREHYSKLARGADSCCGTSDCTQAVELRLPPLYDSKETHGLPPEALSASAGCGNPSALASLMPGETVVDFGSGGGIDCFLAAQAVGPRGKVIGVDMTPDMVSLARSNAGKLGLSNTEFYLAEIEHTTLPDRSADVVISNCVINLAPNKDAVFQEAFRVLRPGGRLFVSDMVLAEQLPSDVAGDMNSWVACLAGAEPKMTYLERMRTAGFTEVEVLSETSAQSSEEWGSRVRSVDVKALKPA